MLDTKVGAWVCMCIVCIVWSSLLGEIGDLSSPPKSPHWGDFGGGLWIKNTIGGLSRYLKTGKSLKWKSQPKNRKSLPPLWRFLFLPLAQKGHFWCVCFCREKNGKGGRYTPIGHDSFAMWLLFYKLEMLQTKVGCLGVHGYCVHSMSNLFSSKGSFLVFSLALREDT